MSESSKINLKDCSPREVQEFIQGMQEPSYRADQLLDWMYKKKILDASEMSNLPANLRSKLKEETRIVLLKLKEKLVSQKDGTEKYLFETLDRELLECAVMKQDYGNTVCVSSQIGCGLGCVFCASTRGGLVRNLSPGEMLDQFILSEKHLEGEEGIRNIVVMGMGEPLNNLENLIRFLKTANDKKGLGISFRNMTVSTVGIAPGIIQLAEEGLPLTLAVSLHAPDNETRSSLIPANKKYPLEEVLDACHIYIEKTGRRVTFEYILLAGVNDSPEKASKLARMIKKMLCHVNLIPVNPVGGASLMKPGKKQIYDFMEVLQNHHISVSLRREQGGDIGGACGQLRRRFSGGGTA